MIYESGDGRVEILFGVDGQYLHKMRRIFFLILQRTYFHAEYIDGLCTEIANLSSSPMIVL